ncbi:L,D-transpeptidase [Gordonia sp. LSe1-13]|uniref:L,D-transpeptidase n=1 Tax=Gordonia sesuvii TaxID=3116777 RepID=A0ABU7MCS3_9ACTN|nr:L,D-transpeptidase [Gordonia sp. LSe1-13]
MNWANTIRSRTLIGAKDNAWTLVLVLAAVVVTVLVLSQLAGTAGQTRADDQESDPGETSSVGSIPMATVVDCDGNADPRLVKVSLGEQSLALCEYDTPVGYSPVTTGRVGLGDGTPLGTWHINSRETDRHLSGSDYRVFVNYWLPFFGDYGFHDSSWQKFAYGDTARYQTQGSRGCIHVPRPAMDELYRWVDVGTTVTILP